MRTATHPTRRRHTRSPDANPVDDVSRPPATSGQPGESDMSLMDIGAICGTLVFLGLLGFLVYKMSFKH